MTVLMILTLQPDGDSPYSDAEYIIRPEERSKIAFEQKLRDKG